MAVFEVQGPDGKTYEVQADTIEQAAEALKSFAQPSGGVSTDSEAVGDLSQKAKAMAAGGVNMATLGLADEATGLVKGVMEAPGEGTFKEGYEGGRDAVRAEHERLRTQEPGPYAMGQVGGAVATLPVAAGPKIAQNASLLKRAATSGAQGGVLGGLYGFNEGEGVEDRVERAKVGGSLGVGVGALAPVGGAAIQKYLNNRAGKTAIKQAAKGAPTPQARMDEAKALYSQIDDAGVQVKPKAFEDARQKIVDRLRSETGFDELPGPGSLTPGTARASQIMGEASERMASDPTAALPFKAIDQMRRQSGAAAGNIANKTDQRAGMTVIEGLDDFVKNLSPDDVVAGDIKTLQTLLPKARDTFAKASRSQLIDDAIESGGDYLSGGSSGIRNQFSKILKSDKLSRGFSDAEKAAMRRVVKGTMPEQILNLMGGGIGQLGQIGLGAGIGGAPGALLGGATAALARKGSEAVTNKNAELVRALVANGGLKNLPTASEAPRQVMEALTRRIGSVVPQ